MKILAVDDDPVFTAWMERVLTHQGYEVVLAHDGMEALQRLDRDPAFDAIILDRIMPEMDGIEVIRQIKQNEKLKHIPVIFHTSLDTEKDIKKGIEAGAYYYLSKPPNAQLILQIVDIVTSEYEAKNQLLTAMEGMRSAVSLIQRGVFRFQTLQQCHDLAAMLAKVCPDSRRAVIGLSELMINALEHGNLCITYEDKSRLIGGHQWLKEVQRREQLTENRDKWVSVHICRTPVLTRFTIKDMGIGFAWGDYLQLRPEHLFDTHGRGILLAKMETFDRVEYQGCGNCVRAEIRHHH